jgi:shikimate dehydrogenase
VAKAQELAALAQRHQSGQVPVQGLGYGDVQGTFDVVLNASSSSLTAELPPLRASVFGPGCLAYDLTYGKGLTPFLALAQHAGVTQLADGVGMLAEQAAEAFAWWRGVRPHTAAVIAQLTVPLV